MGRPEACVLFAQTFVHSQLDEYVDEVIFAEPIVISACEFLEQNASSVSPAIPLLGATSPPSFALEVFVQCEGETRFRRLCQPFLYSHSSSNVLEVEAVVTSHLVVRGSYRSLSLVIYGNTAEDLGQFNIGFDLDSSLSNLVCCTEPKLEDLPPVFKSNNPTLEDFITPPNALSLSVAVSDISVEAKQLLQFLFKILELSDLGDAELKVASSVVSAASSCVSYDTQSTFQKQLMQLRFECCSDDSKRIISDARKELLDLYGILHDESGNALDRESVDFSFMESEADLASPKDLVDMFNQYIYFIRNSSNVQHSHLSQSMSVILGLSVAFLLCSGRDSCFHFVNDVGMEQLACVLPDDSQNSSAITLLLLGVVEQATRYSVGCEGFLGWWPREDENIPAGTSEGYNHLLKLLLQKQSHGVASLATYILHRLRFYEVISRYECAVLSILGGLSADGGVTSVTLEMLINAKMQLRKLLNLINSRIPVDDPSLVARASRSLMVGQTEGLLSYKATSGLIATSSCCFSYADIDSHFLALIKERGFLPLSAALLASPILRTEEGLAIDMFVDVVSCLEAIILSLLFCRSGLIFLLLHRDLSATLILALRGADDMNKEECIPPRYASVLMSKGFFCDPLDIGIIVETHLRVVSAIDRLLASTPHSEEFLWVLWELCGLSRFECGRQALLALEHFPEALLILMGALHSAKELEPATLNTGTSHLNLAIFHSAAEIFEVIVTDSAASSLASWIEHAVELHRTLHSSSHGSNRKDAPTRLLEWIDAGVIYHKNGATGLLQYAAVLASGGDAHLTSTSILVSDSMEIDNVVGEASSGSDTHVVENLGKVISDKTFDGVSLLDSSVAQLTTAFRILAFISENPVVAAALYDEGAMTVIYAVLVNCRFMLERSSNSYDYLVDEGTECNSTSDLLLERNREKSLIDLLLPCLVLLIIILQRLQEANEQHRNKKLMNALLRLHREVSPRLAACAADVSSPYPDSALGLEAVCHLIVSALACWPIYGWTPGLFRSLLASVHATSLLVLGPKETCSFLCLLNDLLPEEGILMWKNGMPLLSAFRTLAIGSLLGPQKERQVNWYLQPVHVEVLLNQLMPQLDKIAQIVLHNAITSLVVIQDMLRVFIIRLACQKAENTSLLLRPIISWIRGHLSEFSPSDTDSYKVYRLLNFLASLLEHPQAKPLLLKEGAVPMLVEVLERCTESSGSDGKKFLDGTSLAKCGFTLLSWALPVFKSISLICNCRPSAHVHGHDMGSLSTEDCSSILTMLLRLCEALPVGRELVDCLSAFKDLGSCNEGRAGLLAIYLHSNSLIVEDFEIKRINARDVDSAMFNEYERIKQPPLLSCWTKLLTSIVSNDSTSSYAIDAVGVMSSSALCICMDGKSLHMDRIAAMKHLFGLPDDTNGRDHFPKENIKYIQDMANLLCSRIADANPSNLNAHLYQVSKTVKSLLLLLQEPPSSINVDDVISGEDVSLSSNDLVSSKLRLMADGSAETCDYSFLGDFGEKFSWECPESLPDRLSQAALPAKRKLSSLESLNKRASRDNSSTEIVAQNVFSRGSGLSTAPPGPSRRDTFRQRKPNTSRPPSMHVDDYVARERNVDGATNSNVISVQRVGSTSGRPPSIHVDEFMARQRERQNPIAASTVETAVQSKSTENKTDMEKSIKSKPLKPELDDDLQGIDIVFDGEESESDDKLPFLQPDDNLQQLPPVIVAQSSPNYIAEETQSESSASCDKKLFDQPDDSRNVTRVMASGTSDSSVVASSPDFSTSVYMNTSATSMMPPSNNIYMRSNLQQAGPVASVTGSPGIYDRKFLPNQPPLPPFPPSQPGISQPADPVPSHSSPFVNSITDVQLVQPTAFHVRASEYMSAFNNNPTSLSPSFPVPDPKYAKTSMASPVISARPPPPPPTPPPFPSAQFSSPFYNQPGVGTTELPQSSSAPLSDARLSNFAASAARLATYPPPPLAPPLPFSRPASMVLNMHTNPTQQQGELFSSILQNLPIPQVSLQSVQPLGQLQPLQPPQLIRPPQPPQHPRLPVQVSQQVEQGPPVMQSPVQMQVPQLQMLHPPQVSPVPVYYQPQQPENMSNTQQQQPVENAQAQVLRQQGDGASRQQDMGMSLQDYFSSPEAIQSLLSDREKLCQLLEEHPKLMQMLQERLGQL